MENTTISFKSFEDIRKENEIRKSEINKYNDALRGAPYHPKDSELTVTYGPDNNSTIF